MARLALRELWITFRLLVLVAAFVVAGAVVALLPGALSAVMPRLAAGLGLATLVAGAIAALSFADARVLGRAGWLVTRSVSRGSVLAGWFVSVGALVVVSLAVAATLGWLTASAATVRLDPAPFAGLVIGIGASALALVALGLFLGASLPARSAAVATVAIGAGLAAVAWWVGPEMAAVIPGAAYVQLAALNESVGMWGGIWRLTGAGLLAAAALLALARARLERADL